MTIDDQQVPGDVMGDIREVRRVIRDGPDEATTVTVEHGGEPIWDDGSIQHGIDFQVD